MAKNIWMFRKDGFGELFIPFSAVESIAVEFPEEDGALVPITITAKSGQHYSVEMDQSMYTSTMDEFETWAADHG